MSSYTTHSRTYILEFLKENHDRTVTVHDISEHLSGEGNDVNVTTIYRYLDRLCAGGQVMKYVAENGKKAVYQYVGEANSCDSHLHLQCTGCGSIIHLDCSFMNEIAEHIKKEHGFEIQCRNSIIYGLCEKCRKKQKKAGLQR